MNYEFYKDFLEFLRMLGNAIVDASYEIINFLQRTDIIPGYNEPFWEFFVGLFIVVIIPYTIIKWAIPI